MLDEDDEAEDKFVLMLYVYRECTSGAICGGIGLGLPSYEARGAYCALDGDCPQGGTIGVLWQRGGREVLSRSGLRETDETSPAPRVLREQEEHQA